jgi:hypothetical protein
VGDVVKWAEHKKFNQILFSSNGGVCGELLLELEV